MDQGRGERAPSFQCLFNLLNEEFGYSTPCSYVTLLCDVIARFINRCEEQEERVAAIEMVA